MADAARGHARVKSSRVIPRLWMTLSLVVLFMVVGLFLGVLAVFGGVEGVPGLYVVLWAMAATSIGLAMVGLFGGSFMVADRQVRSGWPRSRWVYRDEVEAALSHNSVGPSSVVVLRLGDGSKVNLVGVNLAFGVGQRAAVRIEQAMGQVHEALDLDDAGHPNFERLAPSQPAPYSVECALRDPSGTHSKLIRRWRWGLAEVSPGRIRFAPQMSLGVRVRRPWTSPIEVPVRSVSVESRPTRGLESWYFHGAVFELDTGESTIEWALGPLDDVDRLVAIVTPHPP